MLYEQVDILASKNQALQILYPKHHVYKTSKIIMDKNFTKFLIPTKLTTIPYNTKSYNTIKYKHTLYPDYKLLVWFIIMNHVIFCMGGSKPKIMLCFYKVARML